MKSQLELEQIKKAKDELSDELFLGLYKQGDLKQQTMSKEMWGYYLEAIKEMEQDKNWGECEQAYANGIKNIRTDIENIIKNMKLDIASLKKGDEVYTMDIYSLRSSKVLNHHIDKWEIVDILTFKHSLKGNKKVFVLEERDFSNCIVGSHKPEEDYYIQTCFTEQEMLKEVSDTSEYFEKQIKEYQDNSPEYKAEKERNKEFYKAINELIMEED